MELRQLVYIVSIAEEQSISKAAEKLYMTQSALNQQLLKLERELGVPLFNRFKHTMIPTYAGSIYLETARQMMAMKEETYKVIHDIADMKKGEISISYTPERGAAMFAGIYPEFHNKYPDIVFKIAEARVKKAEQLLSQGNVRLAFVAHTEYKPQFEYFPIGEELLVLALPATHRLAHLAGKRSFETFPNFDLSLLKDDKFILMTHETRFRDMIDDIFAEYQIKPKVLFESTSSITVFNMVCSQVAPVFLPQSYVDPNAPVGYFSISSNASWMRSIAYRKGTYLCTAEKEFMELARKYSSAPVCQQNTA